LIPALPASNHSNYANENIKRDIKVRAKMSTGKHNFTYPVYTIRISRTVHIFREDGRTYIPPLKLN
jgi:hypothetical protein